MSAARALPPPKRIVPHVRIRRHGEAAFRLYMAVHFGSTARRLACKRAMAGGRWDNRGGWIVTPDKVHAIVRRLRNEGFNVAVDDDALELYERREVERVHDEALVRDRLRRLDDAFHARGMAMYPYQIIGATWLATRDRALLGDDMGVGKTLQAIAALPADAAVVIVCTASTKGHWAKEFLRWRPEFRVSILSGRDSFRWPRPSEVVILNYDVLPDNHASSCPDRLPETDEDEPDISFDETIRRAEENAKRPPCAGCAAHLSLLQEGVSYVVVGDEAQKLRTQGTFRTDRFRAISTAVRKTHGRVWLTTGTPLSSKPTDLWALLEAADLAREAFGSWTNFVEMFGGTIKRLSSGRFAGVKWNADAVKPEAAERLAAVMLRRMKRDVLTELPDRTWKQVPISLSEEDLRYVDEAMRSVGMTTESVTRAIAEGRGELVIGKMSQARAALAAGKTRALVEFVRDEFEACGEPVVVFSAHRQPIDHLAKRPGWAAIVGPVSAKKRTEIVDAFQEGKLKGVALTIAAGGEGITLTRSWNVVFVDRDWTPSANAQAEDRIYRIGQKNACVVTDLVSTHPLDLRVTEVLVEKSKMIAGTVDAAAVKEGAVG